MILIASKSPASVLLTRSFHSMSLPYKKHLRGLDFRAMIAIILIIVIFRFPQRFTFEGGEIELFERIKGALRPL
jgi:hypothetical protein